MHSAFGLQLWVHNGGKPHIYCLLPFAKVAMMLLHIHTHPHTQNASMFTHLQTGSVGLGSDAVEIDCTRISFNREPVCTCTRADGRDQPPTTKRLDHSRAPTPTPTQMITHCRKSKGTQCDDRRTDKGPRRASSRLLVC